MCDGFISGDKHCYNCGGRPPQTDQIPCHTKNCRTSLYALKLTFELRLKSLKLTFELRLSKLRLSKLTFELRSSAVNCMIT